jgi:hypothetical protein
MAARLRERGQPQPQIRIQDDGPLIDSWIDTQYANLEGKKNQQAFGTKPWLYYREPTDAFLSARYDKRDPFMDYLKDKEPKAAERIEHELSRIATARRRFEEASHKDGLIQQLRESQQAWKDHLDQGRAVQQSRKRAGSFSQRLRRSQHPTKDSARLDASGLAQPTNASQHENKPIREKLAPDPDCGFKASAMYFKPKPNDTGFVGRSDTDPRLSGTFPNQKIQTHVLLEKDDNNLLRRHEGDEIRYFHFPSNNMSWIEEAIARYYNEDSVVHDDYKPRSQMTPAGKILCHEFWRGQMHGTRATTPFHARHMRSRCCLIPRNQETQKGGNAESSRRAKQERNVALFLPYLHWETDSRRANMVGAIKEATIEAEKEATKEAEKAFVPKGDSRERTYSSRKHITDVVAGLGEKWQTSKKSVVCHCQHSQ